MTTEYLLYLNPAFEMGKVCSCMKSAPLDSNQIVQEEKPEASGTVTPSQTAKTPEISLGDLMKLQDVIRGYIDRRKIKEVSRSKTIIIKFEGQSTDRKANFYQKSSSKDNETNILINSFVEKMEKKLGSFNVGDAIGDLSIARRPIQETNGTYTGDINALNQHHGYGIFIWKDGSKYEGFWHNGKAFGRGRLIHSDGGVYEGDWENDKANGKGIYYYKDNSIYEGDWKDDKHHGYGVEKCPDGSKFEGQFIMGKKHGRGKYEWADGTSYVGGFKDNKYYGHGTYMWRDKSSYSGEWIDGRKEGRGVFTYDDGRKYEGEFKNDKKHGIGIFTWPDGKKYEGEWVDNKQHGKGMQILQNGQRTEGIWQEGKPLETSIN